MYCAPLKPAKSARSVRAQRHTDVPKAQKVSQLEWDPPSSRDLCLICVGGSNSNLVPIVSCLRGQNSSILTLDVHPFGGSALQILFCTALDNQITRRW